MLQVLRHVLDLFTPRERRAAAWLVPLIILMALAEVGGIAALAPFLTLMANPTVVHDHAWSQVLYVRFGFESDRAFLLAAGASVLVAMLVANALLVVGTWLLYRFGSLRTHSISLRLLTRYLDEPYEAFQARNSASVANNVLLEVAKIVDEVITPGLHLIAKGVAALAITGFLVVIDPFMAGWVTVVLGGAYGLLFLATRSFITRMGRARVLANQARFKAANEAVGGMKEVKVAGVERELVARYAEPSRRYVRYEAASRITSHVPRYALEALAFASILGMLLAMLGSGRDVTEVVPVLGVYAFAGYRLIPALHLVYEGITRIRFGRGALEEVHQLVTDVGASEARSSGVDRSTLLPLPLHDRVAVEHVEYAYPSGREVLHDISLEIPAQTTVAIVGGTGAGKTTLVDLLLGLLAPRRGAIRVDGVPLQGENLIRWQLQVGYVPQHIYLADDTVTRNIAFGVPEEAIDHEAVREAACLAQLEDVIDQALPDGFETVIGERGAKLSGGQRQRLGIARALYHRPSVLVMDEATSSLDQATEGRVYDAIAQHAGTKTIVIVTHRLSALQHADWIYVLEAGRIVDQGTYARLYGPGGPQCAWREGAPMPRGSA